MRSRRLDAAKGSATDVPLEAARLAATTGADAIEILTAALAALPPHMTVERALKALAQKATSLSRLATQGAPELARMAASLPPELEFDSELARVRPDIRDHELRGRLLFRDIVGRKNFFQVAAWAIAGIDLSKRDAQLLEQLGVNTQLLDPHIWPLAVARRIAAQGSPLARVLAGGCAAMFTRNITAEPVATFMRFLDEVQAAIDRGTSPEAFVKAQVRRGRRIAGFGRPVLGPDERVPHAMRMLRRYGRARARSVRLALAVERALREAKGLVLNSAGLQGAVMRELGFSPDGAAAFCALYFTLPLLAHYAFMRERLAASTETHRAARNSRSESGVRPPRKRSRLRRTAATP